MENNKGKMISTPHIVCYKNDVASVVVMPGDPIRAEKFAKQYLSNIKKVNGVRGHYIYTGEYRGEKISVAASQMGIGSASIYFYELFHFFGVETIIRMGTCGGYKSNLNIADLFVADSFYTNTNFYESFTGDENQDIVVAQPEMIEVVVAQAKKEGVAIKRGRTFSSDVFYTQQKQIWKTLIERGKSCDVVEMEGFALQTIANYLSKNAITLLSVSDNLVTQSFSGADQRAEGLGKIFQLTINTAHKMCTYKKSS